MSIRLRLIVWHLGLLGVALLGFSLLLFFMMSSHLRDMVEEGIDRHAIHVIDTLRATRIDAAQFVSLLDAFEAPGLYTDLLNPDGVPLYPGRQQHPVITIPEGVTEQLISGTKIRFDAVTSQGQPVRVAMYPLELNGSTLLLVASDQRDAHEILSRLRLILVSASLAILVIGLVASATVAGEALRPIAKIVDTARGIAMSKSFSRRIEGVDRQDELGRLAATFNQMLASLEGVYKGQQRFVADASHELRAPLATIQGNLDLLRHYQEIPVAERREVLADLQSETRRMSRLVNDLLSLARADAGDLPNFQEVELDRLVMEVFRSVSLRAEDSLSVAIGRMEPVRVMGDRDRLKQLLVILTDNALAYTPSGGSITLGLVNLGDVAELVVNDTGIGIGTEELPHIFERFYRADKARSRARGGTGLGLSIAQWIAVVHRGEIRVTSERGKGSRFTVVLPSVQSQ